MIATYLKEELTDVDVVSPDDNPEFTLRMASDDIYGLLTPLFPEIGGIKQVFPASTKKERNYPDAVYSIASGPVQKMYKNTPIAYTTLYDVLIREKTHAGLMALVSSVESAITSSSGYQRVDSADDFLEEENAFRMGLNIEVSRPVSADMSQVPEQSLIISSGSWQADDTGFDNCVRQRVRDQHQIIMTATTNADLQALREQVQVLLLGWKRTSKHTRMQAFAGDDLQADAGLHTAVDIYTDMHWITA